MCNAKQHLLVVTCSTALYMHLLLQTLVILGRCRFAVFIAVFYDLINHHIGYVLPGTETVEYKGNSWHDDCFTCYSCKRPIGSQSFLSKGSDVYCSPCYDKKFAKHCVGCNKVG